MSFILLFLLVRLAESCVDARTSRLDPWVFSLPWRLKRSFAAMPPGRDRKRRSAEFGLRSAPSDRSQPLCPNEVAPGRMTRQ